MATHDTTLTIEIEDIDCDDFEVAAFRGRESIGRLFRYVVVLKSGGSTLDRAAALGAKVTVTMVRTFSSSRGPNETETLKFHGMVAVIDEELDGGTVDKYRLVIRPRVFDLAQVKTQEVFLGKSVIEVITEKLERHGFVARGAADDDAAEATDFAFAVDQTLYSKTDGDNAGDLNPGPRLIVQYRETDFAFIARLAERAGISLYFVHGDTSEMLVFTDTTAGFHQLADDRHGFAWTDNAQHGDFKSIRRRTRIIPNSYIAQDYNYRTPTMGVMAEQVDLNEDSTKEEDLIPGALGAGMSVLTPNFKTQSEGQWTAKLLAERIEATREILGGYSDNPRLFAGGLFEVELHPEFSGAEAEILMTDIQFSVTQQVAGCSPGDEEPYKARFRAVHASKSAACGTLQYRPPMRTRVPKIYGIVTGVVTGPNYAALGPAGETQTLDDKGRYEVHFHFDPSPDDPALSNRIRMVQPHVGPNYGHHFPLHPGAEVVISFVDGDPDRPVILGGVPHPLQTSPVDNSSYELNRIKTRSGILFEIADGTPES